MAPFDSISRKMVNISYPLTFNLQDHLERLGTFLSKILIQTAQVPKLLEAAKYCRKVQPSG